MRSSKLEKQGERALNGKQQSLEGKDSVPKQHWAMRNKATLKVKHLYIDDSFLSRTPDYTCGQRPSCQVLLSGPRNEIKCFK